MPKIAAVTVKPKRSLAVSWAAPGTEAEARSDVTGVGWDWPGARITHGSRRSTASHSTKAMQPTIASHHRLDQPKLASAIGANAVAVNTARPESRPRLDR